MENERTYMSRRQAAEYLGTCLRTVDKMLADGRLAHSRLGRRVLVAKADLDALVQASRSPAA